MKMARRMLLKVDPKVVQSEFEVVVEVAHRRLLKVVPDRGCSGEDGPSNVAEGCSGGRAE